MGEMQQGMTVKQWLSRYYWLQKDIATNQRLLSDIRAKACRGMGSYEAERISGTSEHSRLEMNACKAADLDQKIIRDTHKSEMVLAEIYAAIMDVKDDCLRCLLKMRYVECLPWWKIANELNYSEVHVKQRLHPKALCSIKMIHYDTI